VTMAVNSQSEYIHSASGCSSLRSITDTVLDDACSADGSLSYSYLKS
jgi:hypothetical protein